MVSKIILQSFEIVSVWKHLYMLAAEKTTLPGCKVTTYARFFILLFAIHLFLFLFAGCKQDKESAPPFSGPSSLSFDYTGEKTGTFAVVGDVPVPTQYNTIWDYSWVLAERFTDFGDKAILINANLIKTISPQNKETLQFYLPAQSTGTFSLPSIFGNDAFSFNYRDDPQSYSFIAGKIHITTYSKDRMKGTFTATLFDVTQNKTI